MPVTSDELAALRALLDGRFDDHDRLYGHLQATGGGAGYMALAEAACFLEIDRRFTPETSEAKVVRYVSDIRTRPAGAGSLDPVTAERMIRAVLGHGNIDDLDASTRISTELVLLAALVTDRDASSDDLDALLADAKKVADGWLADQ